MIKITVCKDIIQKIVFFCLPSLLVLGKIPNVRKWIVCLFACCLAVGVNAKHNNLNVGRRRDASGSGKFALNV